MKRIFHIARSHGIGTAIARGRARLGASWSDFKHLFLDMVSRRRATRLPRRPRSIEFTPAQQSTVSIAIIGECDWRSMNRCLKSVRRLETERALEIFVLHDPSIDREMRMHEGVRLIPRPPGSPFTHVLKELASHARGKYLYILDSRVVVVTGGIASLARTLENDSGIAAAGSKVCDVSGRLCEAGRAVRSDGTIEGAGANCAASDSRYAFVRDVESVSPASFIVRTDSLRAASSEVATFESASYATADLCFELRALGMRCVYQPRSAVLTKAKIDETVSPRDMDIFAAKWLRDSRIARSDYAGIMLVLDEHVPFDDRDAGSRRLASLLRHARAGHWSVVFGSLDSRAYRPYCDRLTQAGIEVILGFNKSTLAGLTAGGSRFDCVWLSRPHIATAYIGAVRSAQPGAKIVYDTVDLHHLRLTRQSAVQLQRTNSKSMEYLELEAARRSDVTVVTSSHEAEILRANGITDVAVVGLSEVPALHVPDVGERRGVLFVGNYAHAPNVDAAVWLATRIMPQFWKYFPAIPLTLAGADPTPAVKKMAGPLVEVPGFVVDLESLLAKHRVFAAPLRFGAGLKGKIVQAMAAGIPIVTTDIGAEGIFREPQEMMLANDAQSFATAMTELYNDDGKWIAYSSGARRGAQRFSPEAQAGQLRAVLDRTRTTRVRSYR